MKRYGVVDMTYELLIRHSLVETNSFSREQRTETASIGLGARKSFCYDASGRGNGYWYQDASIGTIEGAYFYRLDATPRFGPSFMAEYVAIGQAEGTNSAALPIYTREPATQNGGILLGAPGLIGNGISYLTHVPALYAGATITQDYSAQHYLGTVRPDGTPMRWYCSSDDAISYDQDTILEQQRGQRTRSHSYVDNGESGNFQFQYFEQRTIIRPYAGTRYQLEASVQYNSQWTRRPCPCVTGPSELTGDIGKQNGRPIVATDFL